MKTLFQTEPHAPECIRGGTPSQLSLHSWLSSALSHVGISKDTQRGITGSIPVIGGVLAAGGTSSSIRDAVGNAVHNALGGVQQGVQGTVNDLSANALMAMVKKYGPWLVAIVVLIWVAFRFRK